MIHQPHPKWHLKNNLNFFLIQALELTMVVVSRFSHTIWPFQRILQPLLYWSRIDHQILEIQKPTKLYRLGHFFNKKKIMDLLERNANCVNILLIWSSNMHIGSNSISNIQIFSEARSGDESFTFLRVVDNNELFLGCRL